MLTQEILKFYIHYDPETGIFTRIKDRYGKPVSYIAGTKTNGYLRFRILNKFHMAHRLAWLYMTGKLPALEIDHINRNGLDNRWINLREANGFQNRQNTKIQKNNRSGIKGVSWDGHRRKWRAGIFINGKQKFLGYFNNPEDAGLVYKTASLEHHKEFSVFYS